jgi:hypothetical protein
MTIRIHSGYGHNILHFRKIKISGKKRYGGKQRLDSPQGAIPGRNRTSQSAIVGHDGCIFSCGLVRVLGGFPLSRHDDDNRRLAWLSIVPREHMDNPTEYSGSHQPRLGGNDETFDREPLIPHDRLS